MTTYISADDIVFIHDTIVKEIGGSFGVREPGMLMSISKKPKTEFSGQELYANIFLKAAVLYEGLCNYHVFIDGNKRTAALVMYRFLSLNSYELTTTNKELEKYTLLIATTNPELSDIATWVKKHSRKI
jgi:death-on-curing protein